MMITLYITCVSVTFEYCGDISAHELNFPEDVILKSLNPLFHLFVSVSCDVESTVDCRDLLVDIVKHSYLSVCVVDEVVQLLNFLVVDLDALTDLVEKLLVERDLLHSWLEEFVHELSDLRFDLEPFELTYFVLRRRRLLGLRLTTAPGRIVHL